MKFLSTIGDRLLERVVPSTVAEAGPCYTVDVWRASKCVGGRRWFRDCHRDSCGDVACGAWSGSGIPC